MNSAKPVSLLFIIVAAIIMSFNTSSVEPDPPLNCAPSNGCPASYGTYDLSTGELKKCFHGGASCETDRTGSGTTPGYCEFSQVTDASSISCTAYCDGNTLKNNAVKVCTSSGPTCEYSTRECEGTKTKEEFVECTNGAAADGIYNILEKDLSCVTDLDGSRCQYDEWTDTGNDEIKFTPKCDIDKCDGPDPPNHECSFNQPKCVGNDRVTCVEGSDGCRDEVAESCAPGECKTPSGNEVAYCDYPDSCTNECTQNGIYCDGNVETLCLELDGDGCYELTENDCSTNQNLTKCVEPGPGQTECVDPGDGGGGGGGGPECTSDSECDAPSDGSCTYDSDCDRTDTYKTYEGVCNSGSCQVNTFNNQCSRTVYPTADFTYSQQGNEIKFDASSSAGNVDSITDYSWNFGDGTTASGETVYHEYGNEGAFTVTLTVSDSCSYTDVDSESFKWVRFEGPEINRDEVNTLAAEKRWELFKDTSATNTCMYKDTRMSQGSTKDVGASNSNLENGGHSEDKEVCADLDGGVGMEWADQDNFAVTKRLRPLNITKPFWVTNPDANADNSTGVYKGKGIALEDDCEGECSDEGGSISATEPFQAPFSEGVKEDDNNNGGSVVLPYVHNRVQTGGSTGHGSSNDQDIEGVSLRSSPLQNSQIDPEDDEWALTRSLNRSIDNYGNMYDPGSCYPTSSGISKSNAVYANSYAEKSGGDGNWANPDNTVNSAKRGGISCDITDNDWGYGYNTGGSNLNVHRGDARQYGYDATDKHAVSGPIAFDDGQKPLGENQDDLKQYPDACGDDQNEFLIREQYSSYGGGEIYPNLTDRDNIYVCADRITDCAYNGAVYSEGQTLDISSQTSHNQEMGEQLPDEEICLDLNKSTPGGAWYDKDQEFTVEHRIKGLNNNPAYDGSEVWSAVEKFSDHDFDTNKYHSRYNSTDWRNQTTRYDRTDLAYFNRTGGYYSPPSHRTNVRGQQKRYYSPEGYATEDDCGPLLSKSSTGPCGDVGDDTQNKSWFSAGNFTGMAP